MEGADEVDVVDAIHRKSGDVEVDKRGRQEAARVRDEHVRRDYHVRERGVVCERRGVNEGGKCVEEKCNALGATAATDVPVLRNGGTMRGLHAHRCVPSYLLGTFSSVCGQ